VIFTSTAANGSPTEALEIEIGLKNIVMCLWSELKIAMKMSVFKV